MENLTYTQHLFKPCDPEEITRLSNVVFREGNLDKIDDLIISILPLCNIIYYRYIRQLDDREYAKEDLISDAVVRLYQDMKLRWDKYIHIQAYYEYYSTVLCNGMIELVHGYHNFYSMEDVDPETIRANETTDNDYEMVEISMLKDSLNTQIIETATRILKCRSVNSNLLINILKSKYVNKEDLDILKSRVRVLGVSRSLFDFYCEHVDYVYKIAYNYQYAILGGKEKMISRISNKIDRFEDVTYRMLSAKYYDSIIPEIYAEFGADIAKKFVKTFSNRTIQVPNYRDFCDTLLGGVVLSLADGSKENLYRVAEEYNVSYRSLSRIYDKALEYDKKGDN